MPDQGIGDWLLSNITYDISRTVILAVVLTALSTILSGPIFRKIQGAGKYLCFVIVVFVGTFLVAAFLGASPSKPLFVVEHNNQLGTGVLLKDPSPGSTEKERTAVFFTVS
jgi:hypothetical protein